MLALILVLLEVPPIWPVTVTGWVGLIAGMFALGLSLWNQLVTKVKRDQELNGVGTRVKTLEEFRQEYQGEATERALVMQRTSDALAQLLVQIGEAKASAGQCHADTERMGRDLAHRIDSAMEQMSGWERRLSMQVYGLETELRARGILAGQPPAPPALPLPPKRSD
jgi:hypothetical protein